MTITDDPWGGSLPDVTTREAERPRTPDAHDGAVAWTEAVIALGDLTEAIRSLNKTAADGVAHVCQQQRHDSALAMIAHLQDLRRDLAQTEAYLTRQVAQDDTFTAREGTLPDGRRYVLGRGKTRKEWRHAEWQHDARRALLAARLGDPDSVAVVVDTGEPVILADLIAQVQAVHGSSAPKVTALRALGLDADDYCTAVPGLFSLRVEGHSDET